MMKRIPDNAVVLITGASTGLGLALAQRLLAEANYRLVLTARQSSLPRLEELGFTKSPRVLLCPLDVTSDQDRREALATVRRVWGGVDVLINNAGVAYRSVVEHVQDHERLAQMEVNFLGPMELVRRVLPHMRHQGWGRVINVSSVGGMMAMPTMAVYSASKFALEGATESLWYEVRPWGVHVSLVEPGFIHSESFQKTLYTARSARSSRRIDAEYHMHYESMEQFIARVMSRAVATPQSIAKRVHRVIQSRRPPLRVQVTADAHFFSLLRRVLPRSVYHEVLYRALPKVGRWGPRSRPDDQEPGGCNER